VTDTYTLAQQTGFYLKTNNTIVVGSTIFVSSPVQYKCIITEKQNGSTTGISNFVFYYESPPAQSPSISSITFNFNTAQTAPVSGINIIYGSPVFSISVNATYLGTYFYKSPYISYTNQISPSGNGFNGIVNSLQLTNSSSITNIQTITINGQTYSYLNNSVSIQNTLTSQSLSSTYGNLITLSANVSNITTTSGNVSASSISCIVDGPSYTLAYVTLAQSIGSIGSDTTFKTGYRLWSAPGTQNDSFTQSATIPPILYNGTTPYLSIPYDNTWSLLSGATGQNDLQISNGKFQTKGSSTSVSPITGYIDYTSYYYDNTHQNTFNYSSIGTSGYRFATFVWQAVYPSSGSYGTLSIRINNSNIQTNSTNNLAYADATNKILLFYRFEDSLNLQLSSSGQTVTSNWIDGNNNVPAPVNSGNYFLSSPSGYPFYGLKNITFGTTSPFVTTFNLIIPVTIPSSGIPASQIKIYCRIGLPMVSNYNFESIIANLST
jgi:hypothetical protein